MRALGTILITTGLAVLLPATLAAAITCTPSGDNPITVTVDSDSLIQFAGQEVEVNATIALGTCVLGQGLPNVTCAWTATIDSPGPGSVQIDILDSSGRHTCGPFTNDDGLPVELIEFSVG